MKDIKVDPFKDCMKEDKIKVSVALPKKTVDKIERFAKKSGLQKWIIYNKAIEFLFDSMDY